MYIKSWFLIDFLSIIPVELIINIIKSRSEEDSDIMVNKFARVARVSKLYKLVKITRLLKIAKVGKLKKKIGSKMN